MPIPLFPMLSFSIISHRVSLGCLIHLSLGRPLPLRPSNFPSKIFFTDLVSFILTTCPSHSNLRIFITFTMSGALYLAINSAFVLILHCPFSFVGPYIFLTIFLSHVINIFSILLVRVHVSAPYVTVHVSAPYVTVRVSAPYVTVHVSAPYVTVHVSAPYVTTEPNQYPADIPVHITTRGTNYAAILRTKVEFLYSVNKFLVLQRRYVTHSPVKIMRLRFGVLVKTSRNMTSALSLLKTVVTHCVNPLAYTEVPETAGLARSINP